MSESKSNTLSNYIDLYLANNNERDELEVRFGTNHNNPLTKIKFDNVINKLLSLNFIIESEDVYTLNIQNEYTDSSSGRKRLSNIRTTISGLNNIQKYCKTNTFDIENIPQYVTFMQKFIKSDRYNNLNKLSPLDFNNYEFRVNYKEERVLNKKRGLLNNILNSWSNSKKTFRLIKRVTLKNELFPFRVDCSIVKTSKVMRNRNRMIPEFTVQESNVFNNMKHYEIEIEFLNDKCKKYSSIELEKLIKKNIQFVLSGLQFTNFPISYDERNDILKKYLQLTLNEKTFNELKDDNNYNLKKRKSRKYFAGPSSISLEMNNIVSLDSVVASQANINHAYTVTDKADGVRKLLYIAENKKIYLIDINLNVQFTGLICRNEEYLNTLIDGEHVLYDKHNNYINYYLCFDIYYLNGDDYRLYAFYNIDNLQYETKLEQNKFRFTELNTLVNKIDINRVSNNGVKLNIMVKEFYSNMNKSIFTQCKVIIDKEKNGQFIYETDGLIFTPIDKSVGSTKLGILERNKTWGLSFKWKPPQYNTIDFLVTTKKNEDGTEFIGNIFNYGEQNKIMQYKTLILRVGYDERKHGLINPCDTIIEDTIFQNANTKNMYKPVPFYPTDPTPNYKIYLCNIMLNNEGTNLKMTTENGLEEIEDNMIVEFKFDKDAEKFWQWVPIRVRYDKTEDFKRGGRNYGNAYHVAQSVWRSINNPVTEDIICSGEGIVDNVFDNNVYYNRKSDETFTRSLRDFHNRYVKHKLITSVSNRGNILFDMSVGKAGDIQKWLDAKVSFVLGMDYSKDNIENKLDGACARYIKKKRRIRNMFDGLFIHGNAVLNIKNTDAAFDPKGKRILNALFGRGEKDKKRLGNGVYKQWGRARDGFDIISNQFSIHYFFSDIVSVNDFVRNCSQNCKIGGYVVGTCYDGEKIFDRLKTKNIGEKIFHNVGDKVIWSITKKYNQNEFNPDETSLGYNIDVYQESINKTFTECLVHFEYFKNLMISYGFSLISDSEANKLGLKKSLGSFELLYNQMKNSIDRKRTISKKYGEAIHMNEYEKDISFLNNYFVFKKMNNVAVDNVFSVHTMKSASVISKSTKLSRDVIRNLMAERIQKVFIRKFRKKIILRNRNTSKK